MLCNFQAKLSTNDVIIHQVWVSVHTVIHLVDVDLLNSFIEIIEWTPHWSIMHYYINLSHKVCEKAGSVEREEEETHIRFSKFSWLLARVIQDRRIFFAPVSPTETSVIVRFCSWGHDDWRDSQSEEESSKETEHGKHVVRRSLYDNKTKQIHAKGLYLIICYCLYLDTMKKNIDNFTDL